MAGTKDATEGLAGLVCESVEISGSDLYNSVEGIDISSITDRTTCYVRDLDVSYRWFEESAAAPAPPIIILPAQLTVSDTGRWIQESNGGGGSVDSVNGSNGIAVAPTTGNVVVDGTALLPRDGSRAMTGDLDLGSNGITNGTTASFSGAVTGATFNGVSLTSAGSGNQFLSDDGTYKSVSSSIYSVLPVAVNTSLTNTQIDASEITVSCTVGGITITVPDASTVQTGARVLVKDSGGNAGTVGDEITVNAAVGNIDGHTSQILSTDYSSFTLQSDGTNWLIL